MAAKNAGLMGELGGVYKAQSVRVSSAPKKTHNQGHRAHGEQQRRILEGIRMQILRIVEALPHRVGLSFPQQSVSLLAAGRVGEGFGILLEIVGGGGKNPGEEKTLIPG